MEIPKNLQKYHNYLCNSLQRLKDMKLKPKQMKKKLWV